MTSITPKTNNPQGTTAPASTSSPAATSPSTSSGPTSGSAAAPAASRPSYAAATKKTASLPPQVQTTQPSSPASSGPSQQPAAAQNVRGTTTPVNGKTVPPAVPAVVNGPANGQHSRKSSIATSSVGVGSGAAGRNSGPYMPNRPQPATPSTIQFGSLNAGTPGSPAPANAALAANSPQIAPSTVKSTGSGQHANIQFGSFPSEGNARADSQRPAQMGGPPIATGQPGPVHTRRDSNTAEAPPVGLGPLQRNSMPPNGARRNNHQGPGGFQNQFHPQGQYGQYNANNAPYRNTPTQPRGGQHMGGAQYAPQGPPTPMGGYNRRSPHMPNASPMTTPQMATAQLAGTPQQMYPGYGPHMGGPPHSYLPQADYQYAPPQYPYYPAPHASPRPQYNQMPSPSPAYAPIYPQNQAASMSRSPSVNTGVDLHRPPSTIGIPPQQLQMGIPGTGTPAPGSPGPKTAMFSRPAAKRASNAIEIKNPVTGEVVAPKKPEPPKTPGAPVIVSSSPAPGIRTPSHDRTASRSSAEDQKKREEAKAAVKRQLEERKREEEERKRKEEEERLAKEKAEQEAKEAEERAKKEEEERIAREKKEEEERIAKEAEEKARKEEEERVAKEAAEKAKKEEEERLAKEAEEKAKKEAEEKLAKEKAEKEAAEAKEKEEAAKVETSQPTIEISKDEESPVSKPATPSDDKMMPPPKQRGLKPAPISIPGTGTTDKPLATPALNSLRSARFIDDITKIDYPSNILSPNPALNPNAVSGMGKFKYDKDFLMQFSSVFTEKPTVDWDQRIRESVGEPTDSARPQSSRQVSMRGPRPGGLGPSAPQTMMGSFGGAPLATSAQRFAQSTEQKGSISGFGAGALGGLGGSFGKGGALMARNASGTSLSHNNFPSSPKIGGGRQQSGRQQSGRQQSRNQRQNTGGDGRPGGAKPTTEAQLQAQGITIAPEDIKPLVFSTNGWKPISVGKTAGVAPPAEDDGRMAPEMVQRKVKAALNKMTPEKFDRISDQILEIASQSKFESDGRTLRQVIQLTFEKATDEAAWSSMYAKFCKRMLETMDPQIKDENILDKSGNVVTGGALFRKYLLNRCQEEFERGWKVNLPPKPEGVMDEAAMLSDEYYIAAAAKRRGLGLIQFIGELFKLGMLTERIMHECVKKLVDFEGVPEEEEAESLVKLLRTIGASLDATAKSRPLMDVYFNRIAKVMEMKGLNSRIHFMLLDLVELRKKGWESKEADKGPKTLAEIHEEAQRAQAEKDQKAQQQRRGGGGQRDPRSYSSGYGMQGPQDWQQNQKQTLDMGDIKGLNRLGKNRPLGGAQTFGPSGLLGARSASGSGKKLGSAKGDDSGPNSRSSTPQPSANRFNILGAGDGSESTDGPGSPPASTISSPPVAKARLSEIANQ